MKKLEKKIKKNKMQIYIYLYKFNFLEYYK